MADNSDIDEEALDACCFVLLPIARELWLEEGGEPDFSALREYAEKKWGKVFSTKYRYFDGCIGEFRQWNIFETISHRYSDSIEFVSVGRLKTIRPSFAIQHEYSIVHGLRGGAGAEDWLKQILHRISEESAADGAESSADEESNNVAPETKNADNDSWEPLPIDRENPEYEETIAGIEDAIREIGADNGFSDTYPDERNNLIEHANTTLKSVKEGKVTRKQITEHLIDAGKWVASKFTGSAIGLAGKSLMMWGLKLLGFL